MAIGQRIGPRITKAIGFGKSSDPFNGLVDRDAAKGWYLPSTGGQWTAMLSGTGLANPSLLWPMQESSGNTVDAIGAFTGNVTVGCLYQAAITGMSRKGIEIPTSSNKSILTTAPDLGTNSFAVLSVIEVKGTPAGGRSIMLFGSVARYFVQIDATPHLILNSDGGGSATGTAAINTGPRLALLVVNRATSTLKLYTDQETLTATWYAATAGNTDFRLGTTSTTHDVVYGYCAAWFGSGAEMSAANAASILSLVRTGKP